MSRCMSGTLYGPQYTSPSAVTEIVMFSGLVCVGMLFALGTFLTTSLVMTGMVIRKMISNTNMTSTSGVVLISDMVPRSSLLSAEPMFIAMGTALRSGVAYTGPADQIGM